MLSFNDFNKKIHNKEYEIVKSRSGLPMFVLEPPKSVPIPTDIDEPLVKDEEPPVKKDKSIPQRVSDYITRHFG